MVINTFNLLKKGTQKGSKKGSKKSTQKGSKKGTQKGSKKGSHRTVACFSMGTFLGAFFLKIVPFFRIFRFFYDLGKK